MLLGKVKGLVTGVVIQAEVGRGRKQTILTIAVADEATLVLLVRGGADYFLGKVVVLRSAKRLLYSLENVAEAFIVEQALQVPIGLRDNPFKLLSDGGHATSPPSRPADGDALDATLSKAAQRALRKYRAQKLQGPWKPAELVCLVPLLAGRERDLAAHQAALAILDHAAKHGDYNLIVLLAQALLGAKRERLVSWLRKYTPIIIDLKSKGKKVYFRRDEAGRIGRFDPAPLSDNPFYLHPITKDKPLRGETRKIYG